MERGEFRGGSVATTGSRRRGGRPSRRPPAGAPNVLLVVLDDVGFAQLGCFGSDIATPHLDRLAAGGLRYANFHTTALCSPDPGVRAHRAQPPRRAAWAASSTWPPGFPGYDARIPPSCALLPAMLTPHGYAAYAVGKWHLTPEDEEHLGARRDRWPLGRGFERCYGFFPGETHQFVPALVHDNHHVEPPRRVRGRLPPHRGPRRPRHRVRRGPAQRRRRQAVAPLPRHRRLPLAAPGAGRVDRALPRATSTTGWDAWRDATLGPPEGGGRAARAHRAVAAARLGAGVGRPVRRRSGASTPATWRRSPATCRTPTHELGRLVDRLEALGELDDTLVVVLSDNGASSEGGPTGSLNDVRVWNVLPRTVEEADERLDEIGGPRIHNNYPWGWTVAGNTPFRRWKRETHEGGVADPLIVHWPGGIAARGEVRRAVRARHRPRCRRSSR